MPKVMSDARLNVVAQSRIKFDREIDEAFTWLQSAPMTPDRVSEFLIRIARAISDFQTELYGTVVIPKD
jgi:hypothetical protein